MNLSKDPYNLREVIDACAEHAWKRREEELKRRGIETLSQLRDEIARTIEDSRTKAFYASHQVRANEPVPNSSLRREVYDLRPFNDRNQAHGITVILNPNRNENGQVYGGTCYIRDRDQFKSLLKDEAKDSNLARNPEHVIGGRAALREQDSHRQLIELPKIQKSEPTRQENFRERALREQAEKLARMSPEEREGKQHNRELERDA